MPVLAVSATVIYVLASLALFLYGLHSYYLLALRMRRPIPPSVPLDLTGDLPVVTVQLPVFNEMHVACRLVDAAVRLEYPKDRLEIQVLDDSIDETRDLVAQRVAYWAEKGMDIKQICRVDRQGYKGGALKEGLKTAKGEFIAIFDADFVPPTDFLRRALPSFDDPQIGMVQARWGHLNAEHSGLTQAQALGIDGHFVVEQPARAAAGLFLNFNGTAGVWRRATILDAGNWQYDTLTEDLDLSYRAQLKGWRLWYLPDVVCPGELPAEIGAFKNQQRRWAKGSIQTFLKLYPDVLKAPLPLRVKVEAFFHLTGYMVHPLLLAIAFTLPLIALNPKLFALPPVAWPLALFLTMAGFGPPVLYSYAQIRAYPHGARRLLKIPFLMMGGTGLAVSNTVAILEAFLGKGGTFLRTPKYGLVGRQGNWKGQKYRVRFDRWVLLELFLCIYSGVGIAVAATSGAGAMVPLLLLFTTGFGYVGLLTLAHSAS